MNFIAEGQDQLTSSSLLQNGGAVDSPQVVVELLAAQPMSTTVVVYFHSELYLCGTSLEFRSIHARFLCFLRFAPGWSATSLASFGLGFCPVWDSSVAHVSWWSKDSTSGISRRWLTSSGRYDRHGDFLHETPQQSTRG